LDVVLLFDARAEMRPALNRVAEAAQTALSDLREGDRVAIMAFGGIAGSCKTEVISEFTGDFDGAERSIGNRVLQRGFNPRTNLCSISAVLRRRGTTVPALLNRRSPPSDHSRYGRPGCSGADGYRN
jgi:hypothetical protein